MDHPVPVPQSVWSCELWYPGWDSKDRADLQFPANTARLEYQSGIVCVAGRVDSGLLMFGWLYYVLL